MRKRKHFGGVGGLLKRCPRDKTDRFESTVARVLGRWLKASDENAKEMWSALANVDWYNPGTGESASYSFRAAGDLIAAVLGRGNYLDWYCQAPYATVSERIARALRKEGWIADTMAPICDVPGCLADVSFGWPQGKAYRFTCGKHYKGRMK